jgi:2-dehydro-3-deoxygluconokinase
MPKIACIGECMIELSQFDPTAGTFHANASGDTLNTAVYIQRLANGTEIDVSFVTVLGTDAYSDWILGRIETWGVDTALIARDEDRIPGIYAIETDTDGERRFRYWRSESAARRMAEHGLLAADLLSRFDLLYLSGVTLAILNERSREKLLDACRAVREAGGKVAFDSNFRPSLWDSPDSARSAYAAQLALCDYAFLSLEDECGLWHTTSEADVIERVSRFCEGEIVLKAGGVHLMLAAKGDTAEVPLSPASKIVDTTAAGDSFNAGYLVARLTGQSPRDAALAGHQVALQVIGKSGAIVDLDCATALPGWTPA